MRPILEETIQLQSHISERNHEHSHFQGQLRNCHLPAPIPCPRIATKSLLCRNVTLNSTSSHHLFDSIFTQEQQVCIIAILTLQIRKLKLEKLRDLMKTTSPTSKGSLHENPDFMIQGPLLFAYTTLPFSILLNLYFYK